MTTLMNSLKLFIFIIKNCVLFNFLKSGNFIKFVRCKCLKSEESDMLI